MPFFTRINPSTHLIASIMEHQRKIGTIVKSVNLVRQNASGIEATQIYTLSNRKVIIVLPPERIVKYEACMNACIGINAADIRINFDASARISSVVL